MEPRKIFEIPFPAEAIKDEYYEKEFEPFVAKYKDWIHDIYFTYVPKGVGDVMGQQSRRKESKIILRRVLDLKDKYGVSICPTFNNIYEQPTYELGKSYDEAINRLVAMGVDIIQVPYVHWIKEWKYKEKFPDVRFKDTVLQRTYFPQEVWLKAESGFDIINIDRNVLRNEDNLKKLVEMKAKFKKEHGRDIEIVILANEKCRGYCEVMDEHYRLNSVMNHSYFQDPMGCQSCSLWFQKLEQRLKTTDMIPVRSEYDRMLGYVDFIKMHGRSDLPLWESSVDIIEDYVAGKDTIGTKETNFKELLDYPDLLKTFINVTKNCKIECWDCGVCDKIADKIIERELEKEYNK